MSDYVTRADFTLDGEELTDIKNYQDEDVTVAKQVALMNKTGHADQTPRYLFSVDYVVPKVGYIDFSKVKGSTVIVVLDGGGSYTYAGVRCLVVGGATADGEEEMVRTISFSATDRTGE